MACCRPSVRYVVTAAAAGAEAEEKQSPLSRLFGGAGNCVPASVSCSEQSGTHSVTWTLFRLFASASVGREAVVCAYSDSKHRLMCLHTDVPALLAMTDSASSRQPASVDAWCVQAEGAHRGSRLVCLHLQARRVVRGACAADSALRQRRRTPIRCWPWPLKRSLWCSA